MRALGLWAAVLLGMLGCGQVSRVGGKTFHENFRWRAKDFFEDRQVIALCHAIEANDLTEIDRLIAAGADVNAKGKGNMTPLMWAYPDNKLERFTRLLKYGADPNVFFESDFNTRGGLQPGDSVTHLACTTEFPGYFEAVFAHGGDPRLIKKRLAIDDTPLMCVIEGRGPEKVAHVRQLIEKGADLNHICGNWQTAAMGAVANGQSDIALVLLEAGADHRIYKPDRNMKLVHVLAMREDTQGFSPDQAANVKELIEYLKDRGDTLDAARADFERWKSWNLGNGEWRRNMDAEIAERESREAKEKAAAGETDRLD